MTHIHRGTVTPAPPTPKSEAQERPYRPDPQGLGKVAYLGSDLRLGGF